MITIEVKYFSESDEDQANKFIKEVKEIFLKQLSGMELYTVQIASIDR